MRNLRRRPVLWAATLTVGAAVAVPMSLTASTAGGPVAVRHGSTFAAEAALARYLSHNAAPIRLVRPAYGGPATGTMLDSYNWSGYADVSAKKGSFTSVSASWTVPTITCTREDQIASDWVGLDGFADKTVEQDGTLGQCFQGIAYYYTWYEMYPAGTVEEGSTVAPGDQVTATVSHTGTSYTLSVTDSSSSTNSFSVTASCAASKCKDTSAEWIAERPDFPSTGLAPLVDFGTWSPTSAAVHSGTVAGTIDSFNPVTVDMEDSTDSYLLATISPTAGATSTFTATWNNSY